MHKTYSLKTEVSNKIPQTYQEILNLQDILELSYIINFSHPTIFLPIYRKIVRKH